MSFKDPDEPEDLERATRKEIDQTAASKIGTAANAVADRLESAASDAAATQDPLGFTPSQRKAIAAERKRSLAMLFQIINVAIALWVIVDCCWGVWGVLEGRVLVLGS